MKTLVRFTSLNNKKFPSLRYPFSSTGIASCLQVKGKGNKSKGKTLFFVDHKDWVTFIRNVSFFSRIKSHTGFLTERFLTISWFFDGKISYNQLSIEITRFKKSSFHFRFHNINTDISHLQSSGLTFISSQSLKRIWSFTQHRTVTSSKPHERKGNVKLTRDLKFP